MNDSYTNEDVIKIKEDEIQFCENGEVLRKIKANKNAINDWFYRLDSKKYQLIATKNECMKKEKICKALILRFQDFKVL